MGSPDAINLDRESFKKWVNIKNSSHYIKIFVIYHLCKLDIIVF